MYNQWSLAYLDVQSGHLDDFTLQNMNLPEENEENYLHLTLYLMTDNVLSSNFFIEHNDGNRTIYPDPSKIYIFYRVFYMNISTGIIVEDKKDNTMHGTIEVEEESYLIRGRPVVIDGKNLYPLKQLSKMTHNVLQNDLKDYMIDNKTNGLKNSHKSFKKAKIFSPPFNGPYYVEAVFYVDLLSMTMTYPQLFSVAAQVDYILRDPTFQREAHFILKGIKPYIGPDIRKKDDLDVFCNYTANARANKEEDVSYLISGNWKGDDSIIGIAPIEGICDAQRSCSLIHPTDTEIARTIAHETGHLFGAIHDHENECASLSLGGIMHYDSTFPRKYQWSNCSVQEIDNYLGNEEKCLANADNYHKPASYFVPNLDLHKACRSRNLNLDLENSNCNYLRCTSIGSYDRNLPELLDFVPCNQSSNKLSSSQTGGICYKGTCILKEDFQETAGLWSSWSSWSRCGGDDIIGYSKRTRKCKNPRPKFFGRYCQGAKREYKVCNNTINRNNKKNQALCTNHDSSSIYSEKSDAPCVLYCYVKNTSTYNNIGKAVNGTLVRKENSLDMCLNGAIIPIGCDNQLYSTAKFDNCGICKGDNSQCVPIEIENYTLLINDMTIANLSQDIKIIYFKLDLRYLDGSSEPGNSIVLIRNGTKFTGTQIMTLTDITYKIDEKNEIISSEKLSSPLIIQIKSNIIQYYIRVNYKLKYAIPRN
ncbi:unnamed protein product [Gordionus sp. m RMFG-2023]